MDSDGNVGVYDDEDQKVIGRGQYNDYLSQNLNSGTRTTFGDFEDEPEEEHTEGVYDDLDDLVNEYLNDEEVYSGEEEDYSIEESQFSPLETTGAPLETKTGGRSDKTETPKNLIQPVQQSEKNVDDIFVNSHLQEIVDIKNQIRELQDILHDKTTASGDKVKFQDAGDDDDDDDDDVIEVKSEDKAPAKGVQLKRSSLAKTDDKKKLGRRIDSSQFFKRSGLKMPSYTDRFEDKAVSSTIGKIEKKRGPKRTEMIEDESSGPPCPSYSHFFQKKKTSLEFMKARVEKKKKVAPEDAASEDPIDSKLQEIENIPPSVTSSLRKIMQMTAHTPEEKYKVLDARDKLYKIMRDKDPTAKTGALVGTCPDMCPEKERLQREFQFQVSMFEMVNYPKNTNLNHNYAVKQYCRSSADQEEPLPHELRPVHVLTMTMSYLLHNVADHCELSDDNLAEWYMFMWDRTRALRKELTQQGVCNLGTVHLVEQCARFHIHCAERLADQDSSIYDDKINTENLTKCLQTLKYMYKDLANEDINCPNESEFICYSLLLNLNNGSVFTELSDMSQRLMSSEPVRFALDVMSAWGTRNYVRFFNLVNRTTYLNCCILRRYFNEMRLYATKTMIRSYCTKNYSPQISIYRFVDNLSFEGVDECCSFLSHCNFDFIKSSDGIVVNFNRLAFRNPENPFPSGRAYVVIEQKKTRPLSVVMAGGELPAKTFEDHVPQNSFSPNGELKLESLLCKDLMDFANSPQTSGLPSVQTAKPKQFESKVEPTRPLKDSTPMLGIFGKAQRFATESKEAEPTPNKALAATRDQDEKSTLFKLGTADKPTSIFSSGTSSIFGQNVGGSSIFSESIKGSDSLFPSSFGSSPFQTGQKSIFNSESSKIFGSSSFAGAKAGGEERMLHGGETLLFQKKPEPAVHAEFKFSVLSPQYIESNQQKGQDSERARGEAGKFETVEQEEEDDDRVAVDDDANNHEEDEEEEMKTEKDEEKEDEMEQERLRNILIQGMYKCKQETEKREKERKEAEEKERREREREEERKRQEELERERIRKAEQLKSQELARMEEAKKKSDAALKLKMEMKMAGLRKKYVEWKVREFFNKWRLKTWVTIENRKMKEYFKEVHVRYPPVCTEEHLNGNPYGLVIPNVLILRNCHIGRGESMKPRRERNRIGIEDLPSVNVTDLVAKQLETRAKRLFNKVDPFPWKVVFSVPDESECSSWKDIETFVEMNFVDNYNWQFGKEKGPLYYQEGCLSTFRYKISVRRVRGGELYEGSDVNMYATMGSNGVIFVMTEDCDIAVTKKRLTKVLSSRSPVPQIPLIFYLLGDKFDTEHLESYLELTSWLKTHLTEYHVVKSSGYSKDELVSQFVKCLTLAAERSCPVPLLRIVQLSDFYSTNWFESVWRRIETSLSNYKIILRDPNFLIECYNSCIDELLKIFLNEEDEKHTLIGEEFSGRALKRPIRTESYQAKLRETFEGLKLPHWPKEIPKSSHQLKYRIHQYCKKVAIEKRKIKDLKWLLYRIIRQSLLWKGLDIYCDEDIDSILFNFPWIQLFQELSRFIVNGLIQKIRSEGGELSIIYRVDKIEDFSYESSLISKFLKKRKSKSRRGVFEEMDSAPCVEHDSIIFAYSAALERETNKRKREDVVEENLDDIFKLAERKRQHIEEEKAEDGDGGNDSKIDLSGLRSNFNTISDRLDALKRRMEENAKVLEELGAT